MNESITALHLNPLWKSLMDVGDYFARLGGSARFEGFHDWYSPALVLMCWLELNASSEVFDSVKDQSYISERLWTETNGLPNKVKDKLRLSAIDESFIAQFISEVTKRIEKNRQPQLELRRWLGFVDCFKLAYAV